jgi:hypothetical protein
MGHKKKPNPPQARAARNGLLGLRISDDERDAFQAAADECGLPLSVWARLQCRRAAGLKAG